MYDAGLAERLHDLVGGMFEMEFATMFGGYGFFDEWPYVRFHLG